MSSHSQSDLEDNPSTPSSSESNRSISSSLQRVNQKDDETSESESKKFMSTISPVFFEEKFNAADYLKTLFPPDATDDSWLEAQIVEKGIAREIIQKELANRILESYDSFVQVCFFYYFFKKKKKIYLLKF